MSCGRSSRRARRGRRTGAPGSERRLRRPLRRIPLASGIERLFMRACRGATTVTDLRLDPGRPLVVIFGENGTGKSTLADGIDIVCNGRCGTLDERSSASTRQHLAAVGREAKEVLVELTVAGRTW